MKKSIIILSAFIVLTSFGLQSVWKNDDMHSQLTFTVKHLGIVPPR